MDESMTCLRCGGEMEYVGRESLQKGRYGMMLGSLNHLFSGALTVDIHCCRRCLKLEFYAAAADELEEPEEPEDRIAQIPCPNCAQLHDADDSKCPHCGKRLFE